MISHWGFPKDEKQLAKFAKAGFNTVIAVPEELPACRKYGWKALLAVPADKAAAYRKDPIVWGYHVFDEPARKGVPYTKFADAFATLHKLDPTRPAYINLNEEDNPEQFIKALRPRVLSYDYYQWWSGSKPFYPLLENFRAAALAVDIPLLCWVEAVVVPSGEIPKDNEAKVRLSVYSALAYGAKGIQWWAWRPYNDDAAKINTELKVLGPVLLPLRSVGVFHTPPLPDKTQALPADHWLQTSSKNLVVGFFKDSEDRDLVLVVNRDLKKQNDITCTLTRTSNIERYDRAAGRWSKHQPVFVDGRRALRHTLAAGDGALFRITKD